jgi:hypothetical protein
MNIISVFIFILVFFTPIISWADVNTSEQGYFSGRISKVNEKASLVRVKVDFANVKYLNKKDKLVFWDQRNKDRKCKAYIAGRSSDYLLLKVPNFQFCFESMFFNPGAYLSLYSEDLVNNIKMGKELVELLIKKRLAVKGKLHIREKELNAHIEKTDAVNYKYKLLRDKLEIEWRKELSSLEEDRVDSLRNFKGLEIRLHEIDHKLQKYKVEDENLVTDRWSLDPRLYYKK